MEAPLELSFKNMDTSPFVEELIREKVDRLERIFGRITSCHVYVETPHKFHRKGNHYEIRIEVRVPGTELAVNNNPGDVNAHEEINVAIRDAFNVCMANSYLLLRCEFLKTSIAADILGFGGAPAE